MNSDVHTTSPAPVAECEARVRHFGESCRNEVLLRSGHHPADYPQQQAAAVRALAAEADRGESALTEAFAAGFVAERERLRREELALDALGPLPAEPAPARTLELAVTVTSDVETPPQRIEVGAEAPHEERPVTSPAHEVPSYMLDAPAVASPPAPRASPEPHLAVPGAGDPDETMLPFARFEAILPFQERPPGANTPPPAPLADDDDDPDATRMATVLAGVDETAYLSPDAIAGPATPFDRNEDGRLSLGDYARFLGALAVAPHDAEALRVKHGIVDQAAQQALGARFAAEFERDPKMRIRFEILVAQARTRAGAEQ